MGLAIKHLLNTIPYMLTSIPITLLCRLLLVSYRKKNNRKTNYYHELGIIVFITLCVGIASQTIIPKIEFGVNNGILDDNLLGEINLIPGKVFFDTYKECFVNGYWPYFIINFIGNICLFAPIGFLIPILWNKISIKKIIIVSICASAFIELCQLPQARGTDIDDIWINLLGALLGYGIYLFIIRKDLILKFFMKFRYRE